MRSGARLRATCEKNLPRLLMVALMTRDEFAQSQEDLLKLLNFETQGEYRGLEDNMTEDLSFLQTGTLI
jgi:hypothetical protein